MDWRPVAYKLELILVTKNPNKHLESQNMELINFVTDNQLL